MPAQDSDKVGDMVPKNSRQRALNLVLQYVSFLQLSHVLLVASSRGSVDNENLTAAQRELLLCRNQCHPPIIKATFASTSSCKIPLCQSCLLARSRQRSPNVKRSQANQDSEGAISRGKLEVGDFVSTDQFVCKTPGRLPTGYGREGSNSCYQGGTIYNDAASGLIWVENQVSLGASETIMGKERFEQWIDDTAYADVKHFHGDNGIFASEQYRQECIVKGQTQSFSGVGAQHQNYRVPNRECFVLVTIACAFSCKLERECRDRSLHRPRNKPQRLVRPEKPVRWRWKKRKFGLAEVQSRIGLERSTLNKFCSYDHDFLALP